MKKYLLSVILIALSFSAFCQYGNFVAVRFVNVHDSTVMTNAPINGMIYYNNQSNKFRIYENSVWHDWGAGTGGGSFTLTPGNGTTVGGDGTSVDQGGTLTGTVTINLDGNDYSFITDTIDPVFKVEPDGDVLFGTGASKYNGSNGILEVDYLSLKELFPSVSGNTLTGDVNNYTPSNGNMLVRFIADGDYQITGLEASGSNLKIIQNYDDTNTLTLVDESVSSDIYNRFYLGGSNLTLQPFEVIMLFNDAVNDHGWRPVVPIGSGGGGTFRFGYNNQSGTTYTTVLSDEGKLIYLTNASAKTVTIPPNSSVDYEDGTILYFTDGISSGISTINPGSGVTLTFSNTDQDVPCELCIVTAEQKGIDNWIIQNGVPGSGSGGTVTDVSSANADITVATGTTTPVLTLVQSPALRSATTTVNVSAATAPTTGQVLTATSGTAATWQTPSSGFSDPMTTRGDIIVRNSSNVTARLAVGTNNQVLKSDGTDISWGTGPYWGLGGTSNISSSVSIDANSIPDPNNYTGSWTANASGQYDTEFSRTIDARATASDVMGMVRIGGTINARANAQVLPFLLIDGTYADNGFTSLVKDYIRVGTTTNSPFRANVNGSIFGNTTNTQTITANTAGASLSLAASGGSSFNLSHTGILGFLINGTDVAYVRSGTTFGFQLLNNGTAAATASQKNSFHQNYTSSLWSGSAAYQDFFTVRTTASTSVNGEFYYDIYTGAASNIPNLSTLGLRLKNNGDLVLGAGSTTSLTPSARLHVRGSGTTTGVNLRSENTIGTARFEVLDNGQINFSSSAGTSGQVLTSAGTGAPPTWETPSGGGGLTIGTSTITSGTNTRVLYNNSGVVGEYTITGTGNVVMSASPTMTGTLTAPIVVSATSVSTPSLITASGNLALTPSGSYITSSKAFWNNTQILVSDGTPGTSYTYGASLEPSQLIFKRISGTAGSQAVSSAGGVTGNPDADHMHIVGGDGYVGEDGDGGSVKLFGGSGDGTGVDGNVEAFVHGGSAIVRYGSAGVYKFDGRIEAVLLSGTTLTLDDEAHRGKIIYCTSGSTITITVPSGLPLGFNCVILQDNAGVVNLTASGTTIKGKVATTGDGDTITLAYYKSSENYIAK